MEFKPIMTQEDFDNAIKERLNRQQEKHQKEMDGITARLKKFEGIDIDSYAEKMKTLQSDLIKANEKIKDNEEKIAESEKKIADKDNKIKAYEIGSEKTKIAYEYGLSYDAVNFLQGEDEASIRKSAESLKKLVGITQAPMASNEPSGTNSNSKHNEALRTMLEGLKGEM